jgi:hypothetical protein
MKTMDDLDVRTFFASPRHAHFFRVNGTAQMKIEQRWSELRASGTITGKTPIINIQEDPDIVELHDGNASAVAWLLYAEERGIAQVLGEFKRSFVNVVLLRNRLHNNGETWHPYVPPEVNSADRLQRVSDAEQHGREVRKAITHEGEIIYFNNREFFSGEDTSERLGTIASAYTRRVQSAG